MVYCWCICEKYSLFPTPSCFILHVQSMFCHVVQHAFSLYYECDANAIRYSLSVLNCTIYVISYEKEKSMLHKSSRKLFFSQKRIIRFGDNEDRQNKVFNGAL